MSGPCTRSREIFVLRAMLGPEGVEMDIVGERAEQRKDVDDLRRVRRQLGLVGDRCQLRRRRKVKRERDVLGEVETTVGQGVVADVGAEGITAGASGRRSSQFRVDLLANLPSDRRRCGQIGVVAAGVQRHGNIKERFAGLKRDGRAAGLRLRNTSGRLYRDYRAQECRACCCSKRLASARLQEQSRSETKLPQGPAKKLQCAGGRTV